MEILWCIPNQKATGVMLTQLVSVIHSFVPICYLNSSWHMDCGLLRLTTEKTGQTFGIRYSFTRIHENCLIKPILRCFLHLTNILWWCFWGHLRTPCITTLKHEPCSQNITYDNCFTDGCECKKAAIVSSGSIFKYMKRLSWSPFTFSWNFRSQELLWWGEACCWDLNVWLS